MSLGSTTPPTHGIPRPRAARTLTTDIRAYGEGSRSGSLSVDGRRRPIPRKHMLQFGNRRVRVAGQNVGEPRLRIDFVELGSLCRPTNYAECLFWRRRHAAHSRPVPPGNIG